MLAALRVKRILLVRYKVDFRKAHDGLLAEAYKLGLKPVFGDMVIFIGRDRRRIKLLYADGNGLWVAYKRFHAETMKSRFEFLTDPKADVITHAELALLVDGARYQLEGRPKDEPENIG